MSTGYINQGQYIKTSADTTTTLESNKQAVVNVTDYATPVEIIPSQGFVAMGKVTVTLDLPTAKMYAWKNTRNNISYTTFPSTDKSDGYCYQTPAVKNAALVQKNAGINGDQIYVVGWSDDLYSRYPDNDIQWR